MAGPAKENSNLERGCGAQLDATPPTAAFDSRVREIKGVDHLVVKLLHSEDVLTVQRAPFLVQIINNRRSHLATGRDHQLIRDETLQMIHL
jgi:hypothetical protein